MSIKDIDRVELNFAYSLSAVGSTVLQCMRNLVRGWKFIVIDDYAKAISWLAFVKDVRCCALCPYCSGRSKNGETRKNGTREPSNMAIQFIQNDTCGGGRVWKSTTTRKKKSFSIYHFQSAPHCRYYSLAWCVCVWCNDVTTLSQRRPTCDTLSTRNIKNLLNLIAVQFSTMNLFDYCCIMLISTLFLFPLHNPPPQQSICFSYEKPFSNNYRRSAHGVECAQYNGEMRAALVPSHRLVVARVFHLYLHNLKIFPHLNMIKVIKRRLTLRLRLHSESSKVRKFIFFFCFSSTLSTLLGATMFSIDNMAINWSFAGRETSRRLVIISFSCCNIMCCTDSFHSLRRFSSTVCIACVWKIDRLRRVSLSHDIIRYW